MVSTNLQMFNENTEKISCSKLLATTTLENRRWTHLPRPLAPCTGARLFSFAKAAQHVTCFGRFWEQFCQHITANRISETVETLPLTLAC